MLVVTAIPLDISSKCQVTVPTKILIQEREATTIVTLIWETTSGVLSMIPGKEISTPWHLLCIPVTTFHPNIMIPVIVADARLMHFTLILV